MAVAQARNQWGAEEAKPPAKFLTPPCKNVLDTV